jgi:hypothetical protein
MEDPGGKHMADSATAARLLIAWLSIRWPAGVHEDTSDDVHKPNTNHAGLYAVSTRFIITTA